uniref:Uncharacterized protein n=1 Tax=Rhinopithecus roxellana TaxID=61622 RepID=A0A2K6Q411_RHIRO
MAPGCCLRSEIPWFLSCLSEMPHQGPYCCITSAQVFETDHKYVGVSWKCIPLGLSDALGTAGVWGRTVWCDYWLDTLWMWLESPTWTRFSAWSWDEEDGSAGGQASFSSKAGPGFSSVPACLPEAFPCKVQREQLRPLSTGRQPPQHKRTIQQ